MMKCSYAERTDEFHGWACGVTGGCCAFLMPDSKLCAAVFGEGPDADKIRKGPESVEALMQEDPHRQFNMLT